MGSISTRQPANSGLGRIKRTIYCFPSIRSAEFFNVCHDGNPYDDYYKAMSIRFFDGDVPDWYYRGTKMYAHHVGIDVDDILYGMDHPVLFFESTKYEWYEMRYDVIYMEDHINKEDIIYAGYDPKDYVNEIDRFRHVIERTGNFFGYIHYLCKDEETIAWLNDEFVYRGHNKWVKRI